MANVVPGERNECLGPTGGSHELNLERVRAVNLDDCPEIASAQTCVGNVTRQYNGI